MPTKSRSRRSGAASALAARHAASRRRVKTFFGFLLLLVLAPVAIGIVAGIIVYVRESRSLPSVSEISNLDVAGATKLYYADPDEQGKPRVLAVLAAANRMPVRLKAISQDLQDGTIAIEDRRFYEHSGVDYYGIARAIFRNFAGRTLRGEGASTITQQLARNVAELGLTREKRFMRKIREAILAKRIEETYTKPEILELYLNLVYYGNGAYGAEAAAKAYFGKNAAKLTLSEAAFLAGAPQWPSRYGSDRDAGKRRRDTVLDHMVSEGKISIAECADAKLQPLRLRRASRKGNTVNGAPHFVNWVVAALLRKYGQDRTYSGLQVTTTLDSRMQAEAALDETLSHNRSLANQGCLVSLDNRTGFVKAMVGGADFSENQTNNVTQGRRQPGSSFKPIIYVAAFNEGICTLRSTYRDDPNFAWKGRDKWIPRNYTRRYSYSNMTVGTAIRRSVNTVAVKVLADLTPQKAIEYARLLGITSPLDPYMPLALGASAVRPLEMCSAYSVFANLGKRAVPRGIVRVLDRNGDIIEDEEPVLEDTNLRPEAVQQIDEGLRGVVTSGTGRLAGAVPEARGKTGTTSGNRDAWFDGYTKELSTVVWVASEHRTKKGFTYKEMPRASGARLCVPVWRRFMLLASPLQRQINEAIDRGEEPGAVKAEPPLRKRHAAPEAVEPDAAAPLEGDAVPPPGADDPLADDTMTAEPATPPSQPPAPTPVMEPMPAVQPTGRISSEPRAPEPPREVTYRACADTGLRATRYCPITVERRTRASAVPRNCTTHAGEPDG